MKMLGIVAAFRRTRERKLDGRVTWWEAGGGPPQHTRTGPEQDPQRLLDV